MAIVNDFSLDYTLVVEPTVTLPTAFRPLPLQTLPFPLLHAQTLTFNLMDATLALSADILRQLYQAKNIFL